MAEADEHTLGTHLPLTERTHAVAFDKAPLCVPKAGDEVLPTSPRAGNASHHADRDSAQGERERARLRACSRAPMIDLHQQLASPCVSILLADRAGYILDMVGHSAGVPAPVDHSRTDENSAAGDDLEHDHPCASTAARPRITELLERNPSNPSTPSTAGGFAHNPGPPHERYVFGIAAPINAASGGILGILDRSNARGTGLRHVNALLQLTAETIERRIVESDERGFLLVRFHSRPDLVGGPFDAIALFDRDSLLIGYNRLAGNLLGLRNDRREILCRDCFDTQWLGLVGSAALAKPAPITLKSLGGGALFARTYLLAN